MLRYNGTNGAFVDTFVAANSGGLSTPEYLRFGPDGHLYVPSWSGDNVMKFDRTTGASLGAIVTAGSGGLDTAREIAWGADGKLYVTSFGADNGSARDAVLRFDATTGAFIDPFITVGSGGLDGPTFLIRTSAIPEPGAYAVLAGAVVLGVATWRRRFLSSQRGSRSSSRLQAESEWFNPSA